MRRALLTQGSVPPLTVGQPFATINGVHTPQGYLVASAIGPATRAGTLTALTIGMYAAGTIRIITGTFDVVGKTFAVRQTSALFSVAVGVGTYSISVPIAAGDCIAMWAPVDGSGGSIGYTASASTGEGYHSTGTLPVGTLSVTTDGDVPAIYATG